MEYSLQALWLHISLCLLFISDGGNATFIVTDLLSKKTSAGLSIVIPNIFILYLSETSNYVAILNTTNLDPKLKDSTIFFRFEKQIINKLFK